MDRASDSLGEIHNRVRQSQSGQGSPFAALNSYLSEGAGAELLSKELGVYWGAYGIAHNTRGQFLLYVNWPDAEEHLDCVDIPFFWPTDANVKSAIEPLFRFMFASNRKRFLTGRPTPGSAGTSQGPFEFSPEFYWYLASGGVSQSQSLPPEATQTELLRTRYGAHYCTAAEVTFFLLCWRVLFRFYQATGSDTFDCGQLRLNRHPNRLALVGCPWSDISFWEELYGEIGARASPEALWAQAILPTNVHPSILDGWRFISQHDHVGASQPVENPMLQDWIDLSLLKRSETGWIATPHCVQVAKYGIRLLRSTWKREKQEGGSRNISTALGEPFKAAIYSYKSLHNKDPNQLSSSDLEELNSAIQYTLFSLVRAERYGGVLANMFRRLHAVARFPIVPYYYYSVTLGEPCAHLVVPLVRSRWNEFNVLIPKIDQVLDGKADSKAEVGTTTVALGLYAVRPFEHDASMTRRLELLEQFHDPIASVIADELVYRELSQQRTEERILGDISHQTWSTLESVDRTIDNHAKVCLASAEAQDQLVYAHYQMQPILSTLQVFAKKPSSPAEWITNEQAEALGASTASPSDLVSCYLKLSSLRALSLLDRPRKDSNSFKLTLVGLKSELSEGRREEQAKAVLERLGVGVTKAIPDYCRTRGFGVLFYHVMWQAIYHGLRYCAFTQNHSGQESRCIVRLEFGPERCRIGNLSLVTRDEYEWQGPSEKSFFQYCHEKWATLSETLRFEVVVPQALKEGEYAFFDILVTEV